MRSLVVKHLFDLLSQYGVKDVICSPGSRNANLIIEAVENSDFKSHVVIDERSAAFIGLGMAMVSRRPVALVCTSGSAILNYGPAVAEAFYHGIPLIIISADRPFEWIDQDDSQTIRQPRILSNYVKASYDLDGTRFEEDYIWYVDRIINEGLHISLAKKEGPIHFNIHLDNFSDGKSIQNYTPKKVEVISPSTHIPKSLISELAEEAARYKIMFVAGFMPPDHKLQRAVTNLGTLPNVCIMAETISNLHLPENDYIIDPVLFPMDSLTQKMMSPDLVISIGGALISRKLKEFLRNNPPKLHYSISYSDNIIDCFKSLTAKLECDAAQFINSFANRLKRHRSISPQASTYKSKWNKLREGRETDLSTIPWSDLKALSIVFKAIPSESNLFLSNGTSVRYSQILRYKKPHASFSNRGVSGIEGSTSTAVGAALVYDKFTCLISGDMSFGYDLGGLSSGLENGKLRIIVLDNRGGDIFRFIPSTRSLAIREEFLAVRKKIPVKQLADTYNWNYYYADSEESLLICLQEFFLSSIRPSILHINTSSCESNAEILTNFLRPHFKND